MKIGSSPILGHLQIMNKDDKPWNLACHIHVWTNSKMMMQEQRHLSVVMNFFSYVQVDV